jgi:hypothetical protein
MAVYRPADSLPSSSIAKRQVLPWKGDVGERDPAVVVHHEVPAFRGGPFANRFIDEPRRLPHESGSRA